MARQPGLVVALVLLIAACGGSDSTETTEQVAQTTVPQVTSAPTSNAPTTSPAAAGVDVPELGGTSWDVMSYPLPSGAITNVWKTEVTISFADDGTMSGSAGCNDYSATWTVVGAYDEFESGVPDPNDGQELIVGNLSWTEVACEDSAIMEQETEILDLLQRGARWVMIRENFNLRDSEGGFLLEAEHQ